MSAPASQPSPLPQTAPGGGDRLVLVVDDEADLLQIVSDRLVAAGYRVRVVLRSGPAIPALRPAGRS